MNEIIREYSAGLFALAGEEGCEEEILLQSREVKKLLTREYLHLLINPAVAKEQRISLVTGAFGGENGVHRYLLNFMRLMTERGLATELPACFDEYEQMYFEKFGIVRVKAVSAFPLSEEQKKRLEEKLAKNTGKRVEVEYAVDKTLLGGMRLDFGNRMIDDSVETKLKEIGERLADTVM
ncbi:MAG: ATP synthase F1 subunit delta [Eubacteriales bacterium]